MEILEIIIRLSLAAALGGLIGFEREKHGRVAGFRTHVLVSSGSALIMMVSLYLYELFKLYNTTHYASGVDPSRIASMVIAGIGFIGAGTIIKNRGNIWGLTTAACLWMASAVGLAVGCGYYFPALFATLISLCTLIMLKFVENKIMKDSYHWIEIDIVDRKGVLEEIKEILDVYGLIVLRIGFKKDIKNKKMTYSFNIRSRNLLNENILEILTNIAGVERITWN